MDEALKLWYNLRIKGLLEDLFMSHPKNWQLMARAIADKELLAELQKRQQTTKLPLKEVTYKTSLPEVNVVAKNTNTRKFKLSNPEWAIQETKEIERPDDLHYSSGIGLQSGVQAKNLSNGVGFAMMALTAPVAVGAGLSAAPAYTSIFPATAAGTSATTAGSAAAHTSLLPIAIGGGTAAMSSCSDGICNYDFGDKDMPTGGTNLKTYWYNDNETDEDMKNIKGGRVFLYGVTPYQNDSAVGFYSWLDKSGNRFYRQRTLAKKALEEDLGMKYEDPSYLGVTGKYVNIYDLENALRKYQNK